jgi:large subunit ribosomal protein L24e
MPIDSFSSEPIPANKGIMFVKKDGTIFYFKNSKTLKNMLKLKRERRLIKWARPKELILEEQKKKKQEPQSELAKEIEQKLKEKEEKKKQEQQKS